ncbi:Uncharacterised protein [Mycobacterium tuberculosis]|uniref:Uncharacterized protein n=1 Tax=Mycobacterium tuberculosis TaxID=1773 RepID=A0A916P6V7_MYCTX|nr:Uncharacterised protein [Mycobacterium tuberculosis]CPC08008.1 Uncharacterised protein [Mycobacterium tuberculosis]
MPGKDGWVTRKLGELSQAAVHLVGITAGKVCASTAFQE